jgi:hypothetical protein
MFKKNDKNEYTNQGTKGFKPTKEPNPQSNEKLPDQGQFDSKRGMFYYGAPLGSSKTSSITNGPIQNNEDVVIFKLNNN